MLANTAFSTQVAGLQLAVDSTSLGVFKRCPREYFLSIVEGWTSKRKSIDLEFGIYYHSALEAYDRAKALGASHDDALDAAVDRALCDTWDRALQRPWFSDDANKNRFTLVRTVVWYLDQFAHDPLRTVMLGSGKPAVELSFRFESGYYSGHGEPFLLCGHIDRIAKLEDDFFISDRKTTKHTLSQEYFDQYTPDNQMSLYSFAGKVAYSFPVRGILVDAAQIAVTFSRFQRGPVGRSQDQLDEWYRDLGFYLQQMEVYARANYWPMNDKACFRCAYRGICSLAPVVREQWLKAQFIRRVWDPLQVRGDI